MEANKTPNRIHPLVATAAVSVTLVSLVGIAAIAGLLPTSHSSNPDAATVATAPTAAPVAAAAPMTVAPVASLAPPEAATVPQAPAAPAKKPVSQAHKTAARTAPRHASEPQPDYSARPTAVAQAPSICESCGRIESVDAIQQAGKPSGLGVVAGAVLGGALGNQVGGGNGRKLATVAGVIGGGFAGNEVEKRTRSTTSYQVRVRMEDGSVRTFPYDAAPGWNSGDRVRVVNGTLTARG
jgi:outer membrane lipoprotein SlyB